MFACVRRQSRRDKRGRPAARTFAWVLSGMAPAGSDAQIIAAPGSGAQVVQTQNGLPQVNLARPSGAGVSVNTYSQFDVQQPGAILNNPPTIVRTQQAGFIDGNPGLAAGAAARIIVNQVASRAASQINGVVEVAGQRAEVVIANGSGISINGGGFLNTSRAVLTTRHAEPFVGMAPRPCLKIASPSRATGSTITPVNASAGRGSTCSSKGRRGRS
ncbi:MAG: filamentous hemagglutinin N-terminal domain-containing protein [Pararobbsia sp.]